MPVTVAPAGASLTIDPGTRMAAAWIVVGIAALVAAAMGRTWADGFRYSLILIALYLALTHGDRFAGPLDKLARSLGGSL